MKDKANGCNFHLILFDILSYYKEFSNVRIFFNLMFQNFEKNVSQKVKKMIKFLQAQEFKQ